MGVFEFCCGAQRTTSGHMGIYPPFPGSKSAERSLSMRERRGLHHGRATGVVAWLSREIGAGEGRCLLSDQPLHFSNAPEPSIRWTGHLSPSLPLQNPRDQRTTICARRPTDLASICCSNHSELSLGLPLPRDLLRPSDKHLPSTLNNQVELCLNA